MQRRRFKQAQTLDQRLSERAQKLREEALTKPPGAEREKLLRLARQTETAAHIQDWLSSPGLRSPA